MNKNTLIFTGILVSGVIVWRVSERLSSDAVGLAVGVFLGVLAAVPICFVLMSNSRRREAEYQASVYRQMNDQKERISPPAVPQIVIISQTVDKQIMVTGDSTKWEAWRSPQAVGQIEEDTAYPIEYK